MAGGSPPLNFSCTLLKNKLQLRKQRKERLARINYDVISGAKISQVRRTVGCGGGKDIAKAAPRLQSRRAKCERHVIDKQRPISYAQTIIPSNLVPNVRLKQNVLK